MPYRYYHKPYQSPEWKGSTKKKKKIVDIPPTIARVHVYVHVYTRVLRYTCTVLSRYCINTYYWQYPGMSTEYRYYINILYFNTRQHAIAIPTTRVPTMYVCSTYAIPVLQQYSSRDTKVACYPGSTRVHYAQLLYSIAFCNTGTRVASILLQYIWHTGQVYCNIYTRVQHAMAYYCNIAILNSMLRVYVLSMAILVPVRLLHILQHVFSMAIPVLQYCNIAIHVPIDNTCTRVHVYVHVYSCSTVLNRY